MYIYTVPFLKKIWNRVSQSFSNLNSELVFKIRGIGDCCLTTNWLHIVGYFFI
jgi:hypothetical protein